MILYPQFKENHPYVGTDIKVMASRLNDRVEFTACVPFIAAHTPSREFYSAHLSEMKRLIENIVCEQYPYYDVEVTLNTRDNPARSDFYLTATGSALESGDEGGVGRGNRHNGVIPFTRHMSMEACCGKNPVYHVGKLYTAAAARIANRINEQLGMENNVFLTSQMGRLLADPWQASIEVCEKRIAERHRREIEDIFVSTLGNLSGITDQLIAGDLVLY